MRFGACAFIVTLATATSVVGCAEKRAHTGAKAGVRAPTTIDRLPDAPDEEPSAEKTDEEKREKRSRFGEAAVYVDGRSVGVLRRQELPASLKGRLVDLGGGYEVTRFPLADYATALGLDNKRIKAAHLYGGSRVVVVDAAEYRRIGSRLSFSFVGGDRGKPRVHWPPVKLNVNTTIDMLSSIAFYVDKEPPVEKAGELVMPDGTPVQGKVPYAPEEQGSGTRVYVDGKLVGTVKRKKLTNDVLLPSSEGEDRFSLGAYAAKLDDSAKQAKAVDLVAGDDLIGHFTPDVARNVAFHVPARNQGQILVDMPGEAKQTAKVSAVQIFVKTNPPARDVVKIDEAPEAMPKSSRE